VLSDFVVVVTVVATAAVVADPAVVEEPDVVDDPAVVAEVAVSAFPTRLAVIAPAEKFPEPSRSTIVLGVFAEVAVVAELETFPAVEIVASLVSTIAAVASMFESVIPEIKFREEVNVLFVRV
jgi:hypothetical protein